MVDLASHPSRRTVVKAGLWAAPALAVVNLSLMSAAHASVSTPPCIIGAVIMKITMSSIITSMRLTTLISALSGVRSPRRRRLAT